MKLKYLFLDRIGSNYYWAANTEDGGMSIVSIDVATFWGQSRQQYYDQQAAELLRNALDWKKAIDALLEDPYGD